MKFQRYLATLEYDGSKFSGFAIQSNTHRTVQFCVENYLEKYFNYHVKIIAAGRTDKGVHALYLPFHFDLPTKIPFFKIKNLIKLDWNKNAFSIKTIQKVNNNFHARYNCLSRTYFYLVQYQNFSNFAFNYSCFLKEAKNTNIYDLQMQLNKYCMPLNFFNLCKNPKQYKSTYNQILKFVVNRYKDSFLIFYIQAPFFFQQMIRYLMKDVFVNNYLNLTNIEKIATPNGLYFLNANY